MGSLVSTNKLIDSQETKQDHIKVLQSLLDEKKKQKKDTASKIPHNKSVSIEI
jgi:hypothetical protein